MDRAEIVGIECNRSLIASCSSKISENWSNLVESTPAHFYFSIGELWWPINNIMEMQHCIGYVRSNQNEGFGTRVFVFFFVLVFVFEEQTRLQQEDAARGLYFGRSLRCFCRCQLSDIALRQLTNDDDDDGFLQNTLDEGTEPWGVMVERVEVTNNCDDDLYIIGAVCVSVSKSHYLLGKLFWQVFFLKTFFFFLSNVSFRFFFKNLF